MDAAARNQVTGRHSRPQFSCRAVVRSRSWLPRYVKSANKGCRPSDAQWRREAHYGSWLSNR
jgi:hypothetical protein